MSDHGVLAEVRHGDLRQPLPDSTAEWLDPQIAASRRRIREAKTAYGRGKAISVKKVKDKKLRANLQIVEGRAKDAILKARDAEILLENHPGYLEPEGELEKTWRLRQSDILKELPIQTAKKGFELRLNDLGPYMADYTRNGRGLLIAGCKGHVATMDWRDGKLGCELQLKETIRDCTWLHNNQFFALAQKQCVYIYDQTGVEIHCLKKHVEASHMEFLPYHFLLATVDTLGQLKYTDTTTGQMIADIPTRKGTAASLCQNVHNANLAVGHGDGTLSFFTPNIATPLVKLLCHRGPVRSCAIDREGKYLCTTGQDFKMAVWDIRMFRELSKYFLQRPGSSLSISDHGIVACGWGTQCSMWKGLFQTSGPNAVKVERPYMMWGGEGQHIRQVQFCPFEDVLGVGHNQGFSSIVVPGSAEANFDALELNPYENTKQRQEAEVKALMNKLAPETISLNPDFVGNLDLTSTGKGQRTTDLGQLPDAPVAKPKNHGRGKNSSLSRYLRKRNAKNIIDEKHLRAQEVMKEQQDKSATLTHSETQDFGSALARFARKDN